MSSFKATFFDRWTGELCLDTGTRTACPCACPCASRHGASRASKKNAPFWTGERGSLMILASPVFGFRTVRHISEAVEIVCVMLHAYGGQMWNLNETATRAVYYSVEIGSWPSMSRGGSSCPDTLEPLYRIVKRTEPMYTSSIQGQYRLPLAAWHHVRDVQRRKATRQ